MVNELLEEKRMMQELVRSLSPTADTPRSEQPEQPEQLEQPEQPEQPEQSDVSVESFFDQAPKV